MDTPERIWDCHTHVKGGDTFRREFTAEEILRTMDEAGIEKSVTFAMCKPARECTALVEREWRKAPDRLIPFAHMAPSEGPLGWAEVERAVNELGFRGVKIHFGEVTDLSLEAVQPTFEHLAALNVPVLVDAALRDDIIRPVAEAYPRLDLIVAHLGGTHNETKTDDFIYLAQQLPNVHLDTSFTRCSWKVPEAIELAGAHKILFGSDGPLIHPAIELMKVRVCHLAPEQSELVLWRNLARLLGEA
jgi:predicted TIM-barrel fold metal-dependent hydrolase